MLRVLIVSVLCAAAVLGAWHFYCGGLVFINDTSENVLKYIPSDAEVTTVMSGKMLDKIDEVSQEVAKIVEDIEDVMGLKCSRHYNRMAVSVLPGVERNQRYFSLDGKLIVIEHNKKNVSDFLRNHFTKKRISFRESSSGGYPAFRLPGGLNGAELFISIPEDKIICLGKKVDVETALITAEKTEKSVLRFIKRNKIAKKTVKSEYELAIYSASDYFPRNKFVLQATNKNRSYLFDNSNFFCLGGKLVQGKNFKTTGVLKDNSGRFDSFMDFISKIDFIPVESERDEIKKADIKLNEGVWTFDMTLRSSAIFSKRVKFSSIIIKPKDPNDGNRSYRPEPKPVQTPIYAPPVSPYPDPIVPVPAPQAKVHYVKNNETLYKIAKKYLGNGNRYNEIIEVNPELKANPNRLNKGQKLLIPSN